MRVGVWLVCFGITLSVSRKNVRDGGYALSFIVDPVEVLTAGNTGGEDDLAGKMIRQSRNCAVRGSNPRPCTCIKYGRKTTVVVAIFASIFFIASS